MALPLAEPRGLGPAPSRDPHRKPRGAFGARLRGGGRRIPRRIGLGCLLGLQAGTRSANLALRSRKHRKDEQQDAEAKEGPSQLQKLAEAVWQEWDNFWFGEYWNQPIPVTVSAFTVLGVVALLYGGEYFLVELYRSGAFNG
ncbi:unnamed protein product [Effrenium voratum]|uniref:Uncharacterized protein n=1 Tax=Effrenium voratum TaxID=2562239 RepID=A0AA36IMW2_9DINO|nr:unnamed protein product [Effrenium voratum]